MAETGHPRNVANLGTMIASRREISVADTSRNILHQHFRSLKHHGYDRKTLCG